MGRQPSRASGVKALKAIKETSLSHGTKNKPSKKSDKSSSRNCSGSSVGGVKRVCSPNPNNMPKPKRNALVDVTNQALMGRVPHSKALPPKSKSSPSNTVWNTHTQLPPQLLKASLPPSRKCSLNSSGMDLDRSLDQSESRSACEDTPVTVVQNFLQATRLCDESLSLPTEDSHSTNDESSERSWKDIDQAESHDPLFSSEYAPEIYAYMREREIHFMMPAYMSHQHDITSSMRTILVDWLIEVQENFELFHETLYLAVQLTDRYLSRKNVKREYLQLVGATCMLIAAKFEELSPPLVDDFLYLCDDAYTHDDLLEMERDVLCTLDFDINIPVTYRFLRRLARAAEASMETHTLARYISESTLQDYSFVTERPSYIAACSMYLALRIKQLGPWTATLVHYSGYTVEDMLPLVERLNTLLQTPLGQTATVRNKYSHKVFFKVASLPALRDVMEDARQAMEKGSSCS